MQLAQQIFAGAAQDARETETALDNLRVKLLRQRILLAHRQLEAAEQLLQYEGDGAKQAHDAAVALGDNVWQQEDLDEHLSAEADLVLGHL